MINWVCISHMFWMIKTLIQLLCYSRVQYVDFRVKARKGMLSFAVFVDLFSLWSKLLLYISVVKLAQAYCQFQATIKMWIKTGQNCIAIFWLYDIQHSHWNSFCCICYICICHTNKIFRVLLVKQKIILNLIELISLVGNGIFSVLLPGKSQISKITFAVWICAINKHHSCPLFSASCVVSVVNLAQACCQFQGLMDLEMLKWHTPQNTEIGTMIKADQIVVLSVSVFVELSMI